MLRLMSCHCLRYHTSVIGFCYLSWKLMCLPVILQWRCRQIMTRADFLEGTCV